ncbi:hypothetical protein SOCE836_050200 [Sorangium cellulosum]|uniref:Uncharacterized protein n=1 Tax=Sorangium cellulosum TaxID=56 RepID=A0A4P2QS40_SORCE|nr:MULTISPECIES: hypothetical protein [Sorangium]AUX32868.1 hypothetical protein SOCE836_050200 [Sorangium cellulosum]WCQ92244.1 hypothetical protein NQZ70_04985 [Sorangium sp. Soce836]
MNTSEALQETLIVTTDSAPAKTALRSVGAVLCGLISTAILTTAVDLALHASGIFPPHGERMADLLFVLALAYRIPLNAAGCYIAARLAPARPMRHALALGSVGLALATLGAVMMWEHGPAWYSLANIAIALPCAWVGARLRGARS